MRVLLRRSRRFLSPYLSPKLVSFSISAIYIYMYINAVAETDSQPTDRPNSNSFYFIWFLILFPSVWCYSPCVFAHSRYIYIFNSIFWHLEKRTKLFLFCCHVRLLRIFVYIFISASWKLCVNVRKWWALRIVYFCVFLTFFSLSLTISVNDSLFVEIAHFK